MLSPDEMRDIALRLAQENGLASSVLSIEECLAMGMNAFVGVAQGSHRPGWFVHLKHEGDPSQASNNVWLVGKSITFDSG